MDKMQQIKIKNLQAKIDILAKARIRIENDDENFICFALVFAARNLYSDQAHATQLRRYIMDEISPHVNLDEWLSRKRPAFKRDKSSMRSYRMQWIDWMIQQLQDQISETENVG